MTNNPTTCALTMLENLSPTQFKKVLLLYEVPKSEIPQAGTLGEQAIAVVEYAHQKEGKQLTDLSEVINKVTSQKTYNKIDEIRNIHVKSSSFEEKNLRNRQDLLAQVKNEVDGRLEQSLHNVLINLNKEKQPQQVQRLWDVEIKTGNQQSELLPSETKIIEVFTQDTIAGKLLILGAPGSGKTTTQLELAKEIIDMTESDVNVLMPVLFSLSSWTDDNQTIAQWLVVELKEKYGVRKEIGKKWLDERQLFPLLDGLDELDSIRQKKCVQAINHFLKSEERPSYIVVCSRREEYELCETKLLLNGAIYLEALTDVQIKKYLAETGHSELWSDIENNADLLELAKSPLLLSMMTLAYEAMSMEKWLEFDSAEARRQYLFDTYIEQMLGRKIKHLEYPEKTEPTPEKTKHWLSWLANHLKDESRTEFFLEKMQPSWLQNSKQKQNYHLGTGVLIGVVMGLLGCIGLGIGFGQLIGLPLGLPVGLFMFSGAMLINLSFIMTFMARGVNGIFSGLMNGLISWLIALILFYILFFLLIVLIPFEAKLFSIFKYLEPFFILLLLIIGLMAGLPNILLGGLIGKFGKKLVHKLREKIKPIETIRWSWLKAQKGMLKGTIYGLVFGSILSSQLLLSLYVHKEIFLLITFLIKILIYGIGGAFIGMMIGGLSGPDIDKRTIPNEGIKTTAINAGIYALVGGLIGILIYLLNYINNFIIYDVISMLRLNDFSKIFNLNNFNDISINYHAIVIVGSYVNGAILGMLIPGAAFIQHFTLRFILWRNDCISLNYVRFLDYATERMFLQRIGGGYRFIHRLLQEHFASLNKIKEKEISNKQEKGSFRKIFYILSIFTISCSLVLILSLVFLDKDKMTEQWKQIVPKFQDVIFRRQATQGNILSQLILGDKYYYGKGVTPDYQEALKWFRMAAEQDIAKDAKDGLAQYVPEFAKYMTEHKIYAQNKLGTMYRDGQGVTQDYQEAIKWFRKSAEQRNSDGYGMLGRSLISDSYGMLGRILILQGKLDEAEIPCKKAYELKPFDSDWIINIGHLHLLKGNPEKAREYYTKALSSTKKQFKMLFADFELFIEKGWQVEEVKKQKTWLTEKKEKQINWMITLGHVYLSKGDSEEARKYYSKALSLIETDDQFEKLIMDFELSIKNGHKVKLGDLIEEIIWLRVEKGQKQIAWLREEWAKQNELGSE